MAPKTDKGGCAGLGGNDAQESWVGLGVGKGNGESRGMLRPWICRISLLAP